MSLSKLISNYARFNEWANNEIIGWLKTLDKNILTAKTPSSYNSIDFTLQHILRAEKFWLLFISEEDYSGLNWKVRESEIDQVMEELLATSAKIKIKFSSFTEDELLKKLNLNMPWAKNNLSRYEYIIHIINHGSYHRGQIITMARTLGVTENIPGTDFNIFNSL